MSAIGDLLAKNAAYAERFSKGELPAPPSKGLAIVACMDARLETGAMLGLEEGDAHVLRNAGGVITEDAIRSLVISERLLGTREVMLIHHTDCGMLSSKGSDVKNAIKADTGLGPHFDMEDFEDLEDDVRESIARIQASPFIPPKDQIRGFVYECESGRMREVD